MFCQVVRGLGQLYGGVVDLLLLDEEPQQQAAVLAAGPAAPPPPPAAEGEANGKGGAGQPASAAARAAAKLREGAAAIRKGRPRGREGWGWVGWPCVSRGNRQARLWRPSPPAQPGLGPHRLQASKAWACC